MKQAAPIGIGAASGLEAPVLYDKRDRIGLVSLNRPRKRNAYNVAMRDALYLILQAVRDDPEVRVLLLRGNGPDFGSGGDLNEFGTAPSITGGRAARWQRDVWGLLRDLPQITIAAVQGHAVGGGLEMAMLCDLRIAATNATFAFPETARGMIPGVGGTQTAPRLLGVGRALDLLLTGRALTAKEAADWGIVTRVVPSARLQRAAMDLARQVARIPAELAHATKRAVHEGLDLSLGDGLGLEVRGIHQANGSRPTMNDESSRSGGSFL